MLQTLFLWHLPVAALCNCTLTSRVSFPAQRDFVGLSVFLSEPVGLGEGEKPGPRNPVLT